MSNLEREPAETVAAAVSSGIQILEPREVPLGGPRAMTVRRTLPQRSRSLIGAWCFVDHYGPDPVADGGRGMVVPPHPHTGLQTVSWLFAGEIDHRDSVGSHALVKPGQLNLMTAGSGIAHSEVSTPEVTVLHGAQLWIALPDDARHREPSFETYVPQPVELEGATVSVFIGSLAGATSTATVFTELVGAQLDIPPHTTLRLPVRADFEHGVLVDRGDVALDGIPLPSSHLGYAPPGGELLVVTTGAEPARLLLIGGTPLGESIVMWWNFIGRSHDEIVEFRTAWQTDVIERRRDDGRFGIVAGYDGDALAAPELPTVRLKPRA